jgi:NADPH:quinone reductase-like Zn-dependent oxidoreductase
VDAKIRKGGYPKVNDDALPVTLGRDLSGVVESCGPAVQDVAKGDAVFALLDTIAAPMLSTFWLSLMNGRSSRITSPMLRRPQYRWRR